MKRIQTRVAGDLAKYTENFFLGMSLKQTLLSAAGVAATALTYIFLPVPGIAAIGCGIPFFAFAFLRPDGLPAGQWLKYWLRATVLRPRVRTYVQRSDLYDFLWHGRLLGRTVLRPKELRRLQEQNEEPPFRKEDDETETERKDRFGAGDDRH